ncbi:hypothetical protein AS25_05595 [Kocuria marina]|uniref:Uncharacterized protein n=1 Tax=Kocuria marina TaxID=223184 RepID=A0A0B0DHJ4_9MICC|nr:hypothetical protein [Kocuria marina]KHE74739.1 hypothetical protein AS25_05595 [Kocuria marina]
MSEHPGRPIAELISTVEAGVPADRLREIVAAIVVRPHSGARQLGQLHVDPGLLTSADNAMPTLLQRIIAALLEAGATSVRLPRCTGCGLERMLPERLDGHRVCSKCKKRAGTRAITCHCCRRERQLASFVGDADYCGACWRDMYGQASAIFVAAAHGLIPSLDPAVLGGSSPSFPPRPGAGCAWPWTSPTTERIGSQPLPGGRPSSVSSMISWPARRPSCRRRAAGTAGSTGR